MKAPALCPLPGGLSANLTLGLLPVCPLSGSWLAAPWRRTYRECPKVRAVARTQFGNSVRGDGTTHGGALSGIFSELFLTGSELQLGDELHVARATIAEIRIKRIRRAGQLEARTESRGRVGKVRMVPYVEKFSSQAQPPIARDLLRFDK